MLFESVGSIETVGIKVRPLINRLICILAILQYLF